MFRPRLPQGRQASRKGLLAVNGGVFVMPLTRFLAAGKLDDDFAFDDFACSLNDEVEQFLNDNPNLLPLLRNKILTAEHYLKRANTQ